MNRIEWYEKVAEIIIDDPAKFYEGMYKVELNPVGASLRAYKCPNCGHKDCCTLKENSVNCFSCDWKGTHINAFIEHTRNHAEPPYNKKSDAIKALQDWSGIPYPTGGSKEEIESSKKYSRMQEIRERAIVFFSHKLITCQDKYTLQKGEVRSMTPLEYQLDIRRHSIESLKSFNIMFITGYQELWRKLSETYTKEEIKEAKIWFPEGTFVYPYFHPSTGDILRMNMKNPFKSSFKGDNDEDIILPGMSSGGKVLGFSPKFSFKQPFVIVEGENDGISVYEEGYENVCWIGGNLGEEHLKILEKAESTIYTAFDNDEPGEKYYNMLQDVLPEKDVRRLDFGTDVNDIDEYYKSYTSKKPVNELVEKAELVQTDKFKIVKESIKEWTILNRHRKLSFNIDKRDKAGKLIGVINYYIKNDEEEFILSDRYEGKTLIQVKDKVKPMNYELSDSIEEFFNSNLEDRSLNDLVDIYYLSTHRQAIIRHIAYYLSKTENREQNDIVDKIKISLDPDTVDEILKEVNDIKNQEVNSSNITSMRVTQHFNVRNGDGYFYFTRSKRDGDMFKRIPFLIRNDGSAIRLDLLKRKDPQCLLLIDNKYEITEEIQGAIMSHQDCSLWEEWVDKYIEGEIPQEDLRPDILVDIVETYLRSFYYFEDEAKYKILCLFVLGTYYYELLGTFPYLLFNGEKGSGKSTLDFAMKLFCFNSKLAINISEAALYRMMSFEGGTMIMDEMEQLTSRKKGNEGALGATLKGGYKKGSGDVYRHNTEKGTNENFDIYCPKIISNIFGIEDIILDRCIEVKTYRLKYSKHSDLKNPEKYFSEYLDEIREITSKFCLSALDNFTLLSRIQTSPLNSMFKDGEPPRNAEILMPLLALARMIDLYRSGEDVNRFVEYDKIQGEYERILMDYNEREIVKSRKSVDELTPEGIIKKCVVQIAHELLGKIPSQEKYYTVYENLKYTDPIEFNKEEGWFEINTAHFKCFVETETTETAHVRYIGRTIKSVYDLPSEMITRKTIKLTSDEMIKDWKMSKPRVSVYRFFFKDFVCSDFLNGGTDNIPVPSAEDISTNLF